MSNQLYGYPGSYSTTSPSASLSSTLQRYLDSDTTSNPHLLHHLQPWPLGIDVSSSAAAAATLSSIKRSSEVLYHQSVLDAHNTIGKTEDWYSTTSLVKRFRLESASNLPLYPQRPGEKDCAYYMLTRTCKFGDSCKFDHPIWVPEGGIPDWKEVPLAAAGEPLPERPGEPDCPYFLKTQRCKYGSKCKFNHPSDMLATFSATENKVSVLPERPSEPPCAFYMKTGKCKFGATCKFDHPKDIQIPSFGQDNAKEHIEIVTNTGGATGDVKPALFHNSKGLPLRPDEVDCPFYLKTGSCKYGASCRYNHPDRNAFNPPAAVIGHSLVTPAASLYQTIDARLGQTALLAQQTLPMFGVATTLYPQRPGQTECDYYMKTGVCKFGDRCKFHHPIDRSMSTIKQTSEQATKLSLAGFPRREGSAHCPYYMKTGTCKYGTTCRFDHPPPGEVMAMIASGQGTSTTVSGEEREVVSLDTTTTIRI